MKATATETKEAGCGEEKGREIGKKCTLEHTDARRTQKEKKKTVQYMFFDSELK